MKETKDIKTSELKKKAQVVFNKFIRDRDKECQCISCGASVQQAGHFYSAGKHNSMRFNEDNVHGQCIKCNYYEHGNLIKYRIGLVKKIGLSRVERLDYLASDKSASKNDRFFYLEILEKYGVKK